MKDHHINMGNFSAYHLLLIVKSLEHILNNSSIPSPVIVAQVTRAVITSRVYTKVCG